MADPIVQEAHSFAPLHHAICAISLLNLYYRGQARWEDALEREGLATRLLARNIRSDDDLDSDGILFLHFLLLSYDMGNPVNDDQLWVQHMHQIKRIISNRLQKAQVVSEVCWLVFGSATWLEIQASLAGSQAGIPHPLQYVRGILDAEARMIEPMPPQYPCHRQETEFLAPIAIFTHQMLGLTARTSQLANQLRSDHSKIAALQDAISQLQRDIRRSWDRFYPSRLPRDRMEAMKMLTPRCRRTLEAGFMFYFANVIYSSACMYPSQLLSNPALISDVNLASRNILVLAHASLDNGERNLRPTSFAVFIAGACSTEMEVKAAALQCIGRFEKTTISRNASKAKALLAVLFEEQQQQTMRGERAEEVDWITLARERHMELFDFGL
ncbi:hypothetical protein ANO11243_068620 [Dothideomycetidae sp. 11243]|nr:hypothetical protein ANO11243_068620 [fungal sp. No.11243]